MNDGHKIFKADFQQRFECLIKLSALKTKKKIGCEVFPPAGLQLIPI